MFLQVFFLLLIYATTTAANFITDPLEIHGDGQTDFQAYLKDKAAGIGEIPDAETGSNSYFNFTLLKGGFSAGVRFENYMPSLLGYDPRYDGFQFASRYLSYRGEKFDICVGNFYDQYGSGLILRSFWDWNLGYDNSFYGVRVGLDPFKGVSFKSLVAKQRLYDTEGPGIVRGVDGEINVSELIGIAGGQPVFGLGGSFVSRYQDASHPTLNLPENVAAVGVRCFFSWKLLNITGEYVYKINDPSQSNNMIYKDGNGTYFSMSISKPGIGLTISGKRVDNMDFRSDRGATSNDLAINYIPNLTPQHTYNLASLYPYVSRPNGELGLQADLVFKLKRNTLLGGNYGTKVWLNYSIINDLYRKPASNPHMGYDADMFRLSDTLLYQNFNIEINRRFLENLKVTGSYIFIQRNDGILKLSNYHDMINAHIVVADAGISPAKSKLIRTELQHLWTKQDRGNWLAMLIEYQSRYFFANLSDDYNYGNEKKSDRVHFATVGAGVTWNTNRLSISFGRRRPGIICSGGVCRSTPPMSGFSLSFTMSF